MARRNKAQIEITATDKTKKALSSIRGGISGVTGSLFSMQSAIVGVVGAAGFGALIKSTLSSADALGKTADKLGVTTEALAGLRRAAELTGVSAGTMDTAMQRLTRRLSEVAETGAGPAAKALDEMGIKAEEILKLPLDQQMGIIADQMNNASTQADKVRLAFALFDTEGVDLVNTLAAGSAGLAEMVTEADELGLTLSRIEVAQIEAANDQFTRLGAATQGAANQITAALAPALTVAADQLLDLTGKTDFWGETTTNVINALLTGYGYVREALNLVEIAFQGIKLAVQGLAVLWLSTVESIVLGAQAIAEVIPGIEAPFQTTIDSITLMKEVMAEQFDETMLNVEVAKENIGTYGTKVVEVQEAIRAATLTTGSLDAKLTKQGTVLTRTRLKNLKDEEKAVKAAAKVKAAADKMKAQSDRAYMTAANQIGAALFENNKGVQAGLVVVNAASGIMRAFADLPFPAAVAASAGIAATGVAQLAAISSASSSGGGSISGSGSGGVSTPMVEGRGDLGGPMDIAPDGGVSAGPSIELTLTGDNFSKDQVRGLIEQINEELTDGSELAV